MLLSLAMAIAPLDQSPFALGAYSLGMPIAEAKAVPIRTVAGTGQELICGLAVSKAEAGVGVVKCRVGSVYTYALFGSMPLQPIFEFYQDRLIRITVDPFMRDFRVFTDALQAKYGQPASIAERTAQTQAGASVIITTMVWTSGNSRIWLDAPAVSRDRMLVVYSLVKEADAIDAEVRKRETQAVGI